MGRQIAFEGSLYLPEAVEAAAIAYADHARITVTPGNDTVVVEISGLGEADAADVANAFCNHVLFETIARTRQAALQEGA